MEGTQQLKAVLFIFLANFTLFASGACNKVVYYVVPIQTTLSLLTNESTKVDVVCIAMWIEYCS